MHRIKEHGSYLAKADSGLVGVVVLYGLGRRSKLLLHLCELCGEGLETLVERQVVTLDGLETLEQLTVLLLKGLVRGLDL